MKKIIMLLVFTSMVSIVRAQVGNDSDAKKILDEVSAKLNTVKISQATYIYRTEDAQGKIIDTKKGTVSVKANSYRVITTELEIYSDGKTSWSYDKNANTLTIEDVKTSNGGIAPQNLLTDFYTKDFLYKLNGDKKEGAKTLHEIEMTPIDKSKPFHKVFLWIDKLSKSLYIAKFLEKSGNGFVYIITSYNSSADLTDADFVFPNRRYNGVKIIDLRKEIKPAIKIRQ